MCILLQFNNINQNKTFLLHFSFIIIIEFHQPHQLENIIIYSTPFILYKAHISLNAYNLSNLHRISHIYCYMPLMFWMMFQLVSCVLFLMFLLK